MYVGDLFAYYVTNKGLHYDGTNDDSCKVLDPVLYTLRGDVDYDLGIVTERDIEDADSQAYDRTVLQRYGYMRGAGRFFNRRWFQEDTDTWKE